MINLFVNNYSKTKNFNQNSTRCIPVTETTWFVGTVASCLFIAAIVAVILMFRFVYKHKRPEEYERIMNCLLHNNVTALIGYLLSILDTEPDENFAHDAFIMFDSYTAMRLDDDSFIERLTNLGIDVIREDDGDLGRHRMEEVHETMATCRHILLILTPDFLCDQFLQNITKYVLARRRKSIVPIVYAECQLEEREFCFRKILETCRPIYWSERADEQENILEAIKRRITRPMLEQMTIELSNSVAVV